MPLEILNQLKFMQAKGSTPKLIEWSSHSYNLPRNSTQMLNLLRLVSSSNLDVINTTKEMRNDSELAHSIKQVTGIDLDKEGVEDAILYLERNLLRSSIEKDVARKYKRAFAGVKSNVAVIAKTIAQWCKYPHPEMAYMAGLVLEIPEMIMEGRDPEAADRVRKRLGEGMSRKEAELLEYGFDRDQFAIKLFKNLNMPEMLIEAIRRDDSKSKARDLQLMVRFARNIAEDFSDKSKSPSSIWARSQEALQKLGVNFTKEEWSNKISLLFVNALEFELSC